MLAAAQESIFSVLKSLAHLLFPLLSQRTQKSKDINAMISGKLDSVLNKFEIRTWHGPAKSLLTNSTHCSWQPQNNSKDH